MNNFEHLGILITDAAVANLYAYSSRETPLELVHSLNHPDGRLKNGELVSDGPGQYQKPFSFAEGSYEPDKSPKDIESENFAAKIAVLLNKHGVKFKNIVIFAPGYMQALLKKKITKATADKILHYVDKNYTNSAEDALRKHVIELLSPQ